MSPHDNAPDNIDRRRLLQGLTVLLGSASVAQLTGGKALSSALAFSPRADLAAPGELFGARQMASLRVICDLVIPRTDTPGAVDMDTHGFIDHQLLHIHTPEEQAQAKRVLERLDAEASGTYATLDADRQHGLLDALDRGHSPFEAADRTDFKFLKSLVLFGYFTSEAGASQALAFDPVPGGFSGDFAYDRVGKAWGPGGLY